MNVRKHASGEKFTHGGGVKPPCVGVTPNALPEVQKPVMAENSQTGVSTRNVPMPKEMQEARRAARSEHWYALRVTYGREKKAYDYLVEKQVEAYYPTITTIKIVDGERKAVEQSRLPNIIFARGTEEVLKSFVYDNVNLPYLRFYYKHLHHGTRVI